LLSALPCVRPRIQFPLPYTHKKPNKKKKEQYYFFFYSIGDQTKDLAHKMYLQGDRKMLLDNNVNGVFSDLMEEFYHLTNEN
jgi:hypothetical protein